MLWHLDFPITWMVAPLFLRLMRDHWRKRIKKTTAREAALSNEQAMAAAEARMIVEDLPFLVFNPDKDGEDWVNSILKQLWPHVNDYVRHTLFNKVEPAVQRALKNTSFTPFKFERDRVSLGKVPPRINRIKVYETGDSMKEIIMDLDLIFESDLDVVFTIKGIPVRISDFGLRGMARVILKPHINKIPVIGGVQVYFLKTPEITYALGGVAGILEIPGLNKMVERIIIKQVMCNEVFKYV